MAEDSYFWSTGGAGDGSDTYTRTDLSVVAKIMAGSAGHEGVVPRFLNTLNASVPAVNTLRIASGGAVVDGKPYYNSSNKDVTIPSASTSGQTRIDRVVLRADWTAQTVRLTRIAGTEAVTPSAPAITQTSGTTYDVMLYRVTVDTSGNLTVVDERTVASQTFALEFVLGDGIGTLTTGVKGFMEMPFGGVITQVALLADAVGSAVVDVWKDTYANYPPTVADTICASAKPTLSSAQKYQDTTLTGWTKTFADGDVFGFNVDSASTVKQVTISIRGYRL